MPQSLARKCDAERNQDRGLQYIFIETKERTAKPGSDADYHEQPHATNLHDESWLIKPVDLQAQHAAPLSKSEWSSSLLMASPTRLAYLRQVMPSGAK
ncbi:unnamed protein product [Diplocarpon coronariae]